MVGNFNTKSLVPKLAIMMLTDLTNIPADFTQETSLNGKYLKGISTALTDPDVNTGNANHTHSPDGNHVHTATVGSHSHTGTSNTGPNAAVQSTPSVLAPLNHTHPTSTDSKALAEASNDGDHTHNAFTNDLEHRTITFYKKTNTVIHMSRKSLPRNMTFFYSKTGTLPAGLLENLNYGGKHFKGNVTPGTETGSNLHQHDSQVHNHPTDISDHEHVISFGATGTSDVGGSGGATRANGTHTHPSNTAATINKSSTPVTSGNSAGHQHDNITHEPAFKTLRLMEVNVVKMNQVGVPKNCIFIWLDLVSLIVSGWQVSDGTNNTINMLSKFPKGSSTPDTTGGSDTHTHSLDSVPHAHSGASVGHSHGTTGFSGSASSTNSQSSGGVEASPDHVHLPGTVSVQAAQSITITNAASNHDHGSISNDPDSKTVAFIERVVA